MTDTSLQPILSAIEAAVGASLLTRKAADNLSRWLTEPHYAEYRERLVGLAAPQMVLVDDLETNVAGARAHGWRGVLYDTSVDLAQVMGA